MLWDYCGIFKDQEYFNSILGYTSVEDLLVEHGASQKCENEIPFEIPLERFAI